MPFRKTPSFANTQFSRKPKSSGSVKAGKKHRHGTEHVRQCRLGAELNNVIKRNQPPSRRNVGARPRVEVHRPAKFVRPRPSREDIAWGIRPSRPSRSRGPTAVSEMGRCDRAPQSCTGPDGLHHPTHGYTHSPPQRNTQGFCSSISSSCRDRRLHFVICYHIFSVLECVVGAPRMALRFHCVGWKGLVLTSPDFRAAPMCEPEPKERIIALTLGIRTLLPPSPC